MIVKQRSALLKRAKLYQLEAALPELALALNAWSFVTSPDLELISGESGELSYRIGRREIAHLYKDGLFDLCLPSASMRWFHWLV